MPPENFQQAFTIHTPMISFDEQITPGQHILSDYVFTKQSLSRP